MNVFTFVSNWRSIIRAKDSTKLSFKKAQIISSIESDNFIISIITDDTLSVDIKLESADQVKEWLEAIRAATVPAVRIAVELKERFELATQGGIFK